MPTDGSSKRKSQESEGEDPRLAELREINSRLTTVISFLEAKRTPRSVEASISDAETFLDDHTPAFVRYGGGGSAFEGTRHVQSLLQLSELLEIKAEMGKKDALAECTALLERKVKLLKEVYSI